MCDNQLFREDKNGDQICYLSLFFSVFSSLKEEHMQN